MPTPHHASRDFSSGESGISHAEPRISAHPDPPEPGYTGPATITIADREVAVEVDLRGYFEPIDGYYHWYGRIAVNEELNALVEGNKASVELRTPRGCRPAELSDPDLWGRYRVSGTSTPPFEPGLTAPTVGDR